MLTNECAYGALTAVLKRSTKLVLAKRQFRVFDPGARKTKTGYLWALARDDRLWTDACAGGDLR